jgi:hypothetical protein
MSRTDDRRQKTQRLDIAIDRAVREMLDVEPPAGLRGRVIARIESPRRGMAWTWVVAPAAAAAVIVLTVLAPWQHAARPVAAGAPALIARVAPPPAVPPVTSPNTAASPKTPSNDRLSSSGPRATPGAEARIVIAAALPATDANPGIDSLAPIEPITVPTVRPASITPAEISISPLAPIVALQIAPLSPPDRRN